jgi:hypothetical protein
MNMGFLAQTAALRHPGPHVRDPRPPLDHRSKICRHETILYAEEWSDLTSSRPPSEGRRLFGHY